jgi:hypothetical protein
MLLPLGQEMTLRAIGALIYKVIGDYDYPESRWWCVVAWMLARLPKRNTNSKGSSGANG